MHRHPNSKIGRLKFSLFLSVLFVSSVVQSARADEGWTLTTSDFKSRTANVRSINDLGVKVTWFGAADPAVVPWDKFLQLERGGATAQPRGTWTLHLLTGDKLGGEPLSLANDNLTWRSLAAGELVIPLKEVRGLARGQDPIPFDANRTEDQVILANGDNVKGILAGFENGKLQMKQTTGDVIPVDLASASRLLLASAGKPDSSGKRSFRVILSDGSALSAPNVSMANDATQLVLTLPAGDKRQLDLTQIVRIEQLNGPVSWLSARVPDQVVYQPMFEVSYPPQMDRNYRGDPIRAGNREYARGIGVHAYCKLSYNLDGSFKVLRTQYAMNDDVTKGRVTVRILLDDKVVHEVKSFPPGKLSPVLLIELGNAKTLSLEAHPGGDANSEDRTKWAIDTQARLNWLEPALLKEKPAPDPIPAPVPAPALKPVEVKPAEAPVTPPVVPLVAPSTAPKASPVESAPAPAPGDPNVPEGK